MEPLSTQAHATQLHVSAHGPGADPEMWRYLPYGPFPDAGDFEAWVAEREAGEDPFVYAVIDKQSADATGVAAYLRVNEAHGSIEIGHIWFGGVMQRTPQATEAIYLLLRNAFDELGNRRVEWKCDAENARSRRAAERFGFTFEGVFRQHLIVKGHNRDTAWFSVLDHEWPQVRAALEAWLEQGNFDEDGVQLSALRARPASTSS